MNKVAICPCPLLIVEQQPCLASLMRLQLDYAGFGPIHHARVYTALLARWAAFFGAITLLDLSLQNRHIFAPTCSTVQQLQERFPIDISSVDSPLLVLLEHASQLAALAGFRYERDLYLIKPFDPDELLLRLSELALAKRRERLDFAQQPHANHSSVRSQRCSVCCFTLAGLGKRGRSLC